jgi:predicted porin
MNRHALSILALCAGLPALAQAPASPLTFSTDSASVTLYGLVDYGVGYMPHSLNWEATLPPSTAGLALTGKKPVTGMFAGGLSGSRWGIRASANLGGGWQALVHLESSLVATSGVMGNSAIALVGNTSTGPNWAGDSAVNNQLFARACYGGISSERFGTLTFGRNISLMLENAVAYDPLVAAQLFSPLGFSGTYGGGGSTENSRVDNSLKYKVKVGDVNFGGVYKFGNVAGAQSAQSAIQANLGYEKGPFGIQASYQTFKDAFGMSNASAATLGKVPLTAYDTSSWMVCAKYALGPVTLKAGHQFIEYTNPSNPVEDSALTSIFGVLISSVNVHKFDTGAKNLHMTWFGGAWDVTKKLVIYAGHYHVSQNDFSAGTATASAKSGTSKYDSLVVDYKITKRFDVYAGYMGNASTGGMAIGAPFFSTNSLLGAGFRFSF